MSHDFSFDKKSVFFILGGCVAVGVLLFFAGFILGWDRGTHQARLEIQQKNAPVVAKNLPANAPQEQHSANPPVSEAQPAKPSPLPAAAGSAKSAASGGDSAAKDSEAKSGQPPAPSASPENDSPDPTGFSLQVGAFQNENNALRCQTSFKSRGYPVFMFNTLDAAGRAWHTVRMGHYSDMKKAVEAAATFTGKEKTPVFVRPLNEL